MPCRQVSAPDAITAGRSPEVQAEAPGGLKLKPLEVCEGLQRPALPVRQLSVARRRRQPASRHLCRGRGRSPAREIRGIREGSGGGGGGGGCASVGASAAPPHGANSITCPPAFLRASGPTQSRRTQSEKSALAHPKPSRLYLQGFSRENPSCSLFVPQFEVRICSMQWRRSSSGGHALHDQPEVPQALAVTLGAVEEPQAVALVLRPQAFQARVVRAARKEVAVLAAQDEPAGRLVEAGGICVAQVRQPEQIGHVGVVHRCSVAPAVDLECVDLVAAGVLDDAILAHSSSTMLAISSSSDARSASFIGPFAISAALRRATTTMIF
ncbi:unnamed protein product [Prorocentrum cordatum]|uniref:Uncharacterized protein n=1 Tax=Prorocentrum cordatum TaxID=2364126 RepID=A0ABN9WAS1_9DINO|nr:unnamed protein product [Polarella glacialis]